MAPVLVCPECSTKHPLDSIGPRSVFPCTGCGRSLKVPTQAIASSPAAPPVAPTAAAATPDPNATGVRSPAASPAAVATAPPVAPGPPPGIPVRGPASPVAEWRDPVPPRWVRFALWIVAIPLAFVVVFALARVVGFLTTNEITDVALAEGWRRFVPIARLIPFVALATALFVHGGVFGIARLRQRRWSSPAADAESNGSRPRQSSRTGA